MNDRNEILSYDEDAPIREIIKRLRNIVNSKQNYHSRLTYKKVEIASSLLDVFVFKCTQLTEKALINAEETFQQNEKNSLKSKRMLATLMLCEGSAPYDSCLPG
ncbi:hypothetical protein AVEN_174730-1 [Araneus ventricosus]|uniref:Uncharacterized protein n=1 Tax=Araneus ventricosus TaxID=182803 RepID=A0A4Y2BJQ1_ARAVE|nr:hypothetical protein AVEN_174730-1 [Araneus ventricosus]